MTMEVEIVVAYYGISVDRSGKILGYVRVAADHSHHSIIEVA